MDSKMTKNKMWSVDEIITLLCVDYPPLKRKHLEKLTVKQIVEIATKRFDCKFEIIK